MRKLDTRFGDNILWQFIKFNLVSFSITLLQLALANLLPLIFDGVAAKLPPVLRPVFQPDILFEGPSPYVVDGVVTWGYVLPFFLSNFIANIYGYFMMGICAPVLPVKFHRQHLRLFHEHEDHIPRQRKPERTRCVSADPGSADSLFYVAAGMDHRQIVCYDLCGAGQDHCRRSCRTCAGSRVVPVGKICVV